MRLAALGLHHESNTFSPLPADVAAFADGGVLRGEEVRDRYAGSEAQMGGFLAVGEVPGVEVVPLLFAYIEPRGTITAEAFEEIVAEMLARLADGGPWDGVLLAQHGAAVAEHCPDVDGEIAARVRAAVGPDVPIGLALDMHANVSARMVACSTVAVPYQTNPHVDARESAFACAELVARTVRGEIRPVQALVAPPLVPDILRQRTDRDPLRALLGDAAALRRRPGMLAASVVAGFAYADVAEMGMSLLAVHDGDAGRAEAGARWSAERAWARRHEMTGRAEPVDRALRTAATAPRGPVVLLDIGDNIGGGAPGDSTVLLEAARRLGVRGYVQTLFDPAAVRRCRAVGVGADVSLQVGARSDRRHGRPVRVDARVRLVADGRYEAPPPVHGGHRSFDAGPTVVLETTDEHTLVLTSRRVPNTSLRQLHALGIVPEHFQVIVAKGVNAPIAAYEPIAAEVLLVDTPGATSADLSRFEYRHRRRPLFPFEPDATFHLLPR